MIYLITALTISITILGIHYLSESILSNLLGITLDDIYDEFGKVAFPIIYCPTCMTSLWGVPLLALFPETFTFYEYVLIFFQIGFFNHVVSKYI